MDKKSVNVVDAYQSFRDFILTHAKPKDDTPELQEAFNALDVFFVGGNEGTGTVTPGIETYQSMKAELARFDELKSELKDNIQPATSALRAIVEKMEKPRLVPIVDQMRVKNDGHPGVEMEPAPKPDVPCPKCGHVLTGPNRQHSMYGACWVRDCKCGLNDWQREGAPAPGPVEYVQCAKHKPSTVIDASCPWCEIEQLTNKNAEQEMEKKRAKLWDDQRDAIARTWKP